MPKHARARARATCRSVPRRAPARGPFEEHNGFRIGGPNPRRIRNRNRIRNRIRTRSRSGGYLAVLRLAISAFACVIAIARASVASTSSSAACPASRTRCAELILRRLAVAGDRAFDQRRRIRAHFDLRARAHEQHHAARLAQRQRRADVLARTRPRPPCSSACACHHRRQLIEDRPQHSCSGASVAVAITPASIPISFGPARRTTPQPVRIVPGSTPSTIMRATGSRVLLPTARNRRTPSARRRGLRALRPG